MKTINTLVALIMILLVMNGCATTQQSKQTTPDITLAANTKEATFAIEGMYCASCSIGVEAQWKELDGVLDATVNLEEASGKVLYDADKIDAETIAQASTVYPATINSDRNLK